MPGAGARWNRSEAPERARRRWLVPLAALVLTAGALGLVTATRRGDSGSAGTRVPTAPGAPAPPPATAPPPAGDPAVGTAHHVSPDGADEAPGTAEAPWRSLRHALAALQPGDTLYVEEGTYREKVDLAASELRPGTPVAPIHVLAAPGAHPVIEGLLWLEGPSHWVIEGLSVTWDASSRPDQHMVKLRGGEGWRFTGNELWGARSYAALLVGRGASDFRIDGNYLHDTHPSNDANQDHLLYVDNGPDGSGVVERNVFAHSPNGRGVKLGPGSDGAPGTSNIVVRFNTFYDNTGPSNLQLSGSSSNNQIYGNLFHTAGEGEANITGFRLTGQANVVSGNLGWGSAGVADLSWDGLVDGGGNVELDPLLADPEGGDFTPTDEAATAYGALAAGVSSASRDVAAATSGRVRRRAGAGIGARLSRRRRPLTSRPTTSSTQGRANIHRPAP